MKKLLILALAAGMVTAFALTAVALQAPSSITLDVAGQGTVTFDHALHEANVNGCKTCHHFGVGNGECRGCHGQAPQAPALADALAQNCAQCHTPATTSEPVPAMSCSDYGDKDSCNADSNCRWNRKKEQCRDR